MRTIVEPKEYVDKLWGKQQIRDGVNYRMMRYVLRKDYDGSVLLHNVVTGQLVVLEQCEAEMLENLPQQYDAVMEQLVLYHYLVPEGYDEHQQVVNLRKILRSLEDAPSQEITNYTILPTTACNARCYYCFESGVHQITMTEQVADATVQFISDHCGSEKKISIRWFGGEPTVAASRIDRICNGLQNKGIHYTSTMTTNGYLFDEEMIKRAVSLWKLKEVMISVDGIEERYNSIKSYTNARDNPYQRVLRNVGLLLDQEVHVNLRMNFDLDNFEDFQELLKEVGKRFHKTQPLKVYAFPIIGEYPRNGCIKHGSDTWFDDKIAELNDMAVEAGFFHRPKRLPSLFYTRCIAGEPSSLVVDANGMLTKCTRMFRDEEWVVGSVVNGINTSDMRVFCDSMNEFANPERCIDCTLFPDCVLLEKCPSKNRCFRQEIFRWSESAIINVYNIWKLSLK